MAGSSFGQSFVVTTFGESHGAAVGCVVDGCPAGVPLHVADIEHALARRRPGQNTLTSPRREPDQPRLLSGVYKGLTLGTPIAIVVDNVDARAKDYETWPELFRPGHGDFAWFARYGHRDPRGGGRASARETVGRVAAGAVAEALLRALAVRDERPQPRIVAWTQQIGAVAMPDEAPVDRAHVDASPVRCPDAAASAAMVLAIEAAQRDRDSLGGIVRCVVTDLPAGLGDPVFDKMTGLLAHALGSLPAVRGVLFGDGMAAVAIRGSQHNDPFTRLADGSIATTTNHHGGTLGGITTGMPLRFDVLFKPVATIPQPQQAIGPQGPPAPLTVTGRHDPCVVPRAVPIVEAAVAIVLADLSLRIGRL
jgi:chorismate synthase